MEDHGATALHLAAAKGFTDVTRLLVMIGANCEHIDRQGRLLINLLHLEMLHAN